MPLILEGIVTTQNADGSTNVAPMGPIVTADMRQLTLRPFQTSTTFANLARTRCGVFHIVDDVLLLAKAAVDRLDVMPALLPAQTVDGAILADACRWYEFKVTQIDDAYDRAELTAQVVDSGRIRDYFGLNRAKHAVLEAAILATRLHLIPPAEIQRQLAALRAPVEKTAGPREWEAFQFLERFVAEFAGDVQRDRPKEESACSAAFDEDDG